jgi:CHAD domain-containing protein
MEPPPLEIEWQFEAPCVERAAEWLEGRLGVPFGPAATLKDSYLDTPDRRFFRAGRTLRLRKRGRRREATLKTHAPSEDGLRRRAEFTEPMAGGDPKALPGEVGRRVRDLAGGEPVETVFSVRTLRRVLRGELDGAAVEVALDESWAIQRGQSHPIGSRIEVEVAQITPEAERLAAEIRAELGAEPCSTSKPEAARLALGLPEAPAPYRPEQVFPQDPAGLAARKVLRKHFEAILAREPGTRLGDDIEELHQMRVATRRIRAALSLFREVLPAQAEAVRERFRWLGSLLGEVRDLDVQIERMEGWRDAGHIEPEAAEFLTGILQARRHEVRARMISGLDSRAYRRLRAAMERLLATHPARSGPASAPVALVGPSLIERRRRAARKTGDRLEPDSPPEAYHAMRIRAKRLRYAIEYLADLYGKPGKEYVKRLVALQDLLGEHQDDYVAMALLQELSSHDAPAGTVFSLGRLSGRFEANAARLRAGFPDAYAGIRGKPWRALRETFGRDLREGWRLMGAAPEPPYGDRGGEPAPERMTSATANERRMS